MLMFYWICICQPLTHTLTLLIKARVITIEFHTRIAILYTGIGT